MTDDGADRGQTAERREGDRPGMGAPEGGYRIFFTDLDGTLLDSQKQVSPALRALLGRMTKRGKRLVLSSGRLLCSVRKVAEKQNILFPRCLISAANGSIVYDVDSGRLLRSMSVPLPLCRQIEEFAKRRGVYLQTYEGDLVVSYRRTRALDDYLQKNGMEAVITDDLTGALSRPPVKLLAMEEKDPEKLNLLQRDILGAFGHRLSAIFSCPQYLEIFDRRAGKGSALKFLCDYLQIPTAASVAAGDEENDISMLRQAGVGVAMANASAPVKECADYVTPRDNDHDGVADVINRFFL